MVHAALLLLMLEAMNMDLVSTISLKRSTQNLQLSTSCRPITPSSPLIVLQKSKVAGLEIFRENTTRELIADSYTLSPVTEVTCAFNVSDEAPHIPQKFSSPVQNDFCNTIPLKADMWADTP
jgi:hypothetical protein